MCIRSANMTGWARTDRFSKPNTTNQNCPICTLSIKDMLERAERGGGGKHQAAYSSKYTHTGVNDSQKARVSSNSRGRIQNSNPAIHAKKKSRHRIVRKVTMMTSNVTERYHIHTCHAVGRSRVVPVCFGSFGYCRAGMVYFHGSLSFRISSQDHEDHKHSIVGTGNRNTRVPTSRETAVFFFFI